MTTKREISNSWVNNKRRSLLVALERMDLKTETDSRRRQSNATKMTSQAGLQAKQRYHALMHSDSASFEPINRSQSLPSTVYQPVSTGTKQSSTGSISQPVHRSSVGSICQPFDNGNRSSTGSTFHPVVNRSLTRSQGSVNRSLSGPFSPPGSRASTVSFCQPVDHANRTSAGYISQPCDQRLKPFSDVLRSLHSIVPGNMDAPSGGGGDPRIPPQQRRSYNERVNVNRKWQSSSNDATCLTDVGVVGDVCVQSVRSVGGASSVVGGVCVKSLRCVGGDSKHFFSDTSIMSSAVTSKRPKESVNLTKSTVSQRVKPQQYVDPLPNSSPLFQQRIKDLQVLEADTMRQEHNKILEQEKRATNAAKKKL